jgi:MazG family protein
MTVKSQDGSTLTRLMAIMRRLLADGGCPWDREQSFATLKKYVVEEAYEVLDAIDALGPDAERTVTGPAPELGGGSPQVAALRDELGDLLLQVAFQAELARARDWFGMDDVVGAISDKLERRHPHVFGDAAVSGAAEVGERWEEIKAREKAGRGTLSGMPRGLPALLYAFRLGEKASNVGFDWPDDRGPREKIDEECRELDEALARGDRASVEHEVGDLLFSVVNLARKHGIDPEEALRRTNRRFETRFGAVERRVVASGRTVREASLEELDSYWNDAKRDDGGESR